MIKLKAPLNHRGHIIDEGTIINLGDREKSLIDNGTAEEYNPVAVTAKAGKKDKKDE